MTIVCKWKRKRNWSVIFGWKKYTHRNYAPRKMRFKYRYLFTDHVPYI